MSSIASNAEDLILNADGGSSTVKIKINGTEKASISSAGAFTSTTIDATKLTGALPAISGAALTGVGVAGITSSADSTAMTIGSDENITISNSNNADTVLTIDSQTANGNIGILKLAGDVAGAGYGAGHQSAKINFFQSAEHICTISSKRSEGDEGELSFQTRDASDAAPVERLIIKKDGNVGIGRTPEAWKSSMTALALGQSNAVYARSDNQAITLAKNFYHNSSSQDIAIATDQAAKLELNSGQIRFFTAGTTSSGSAISWNSALTIHDNGYSVFEKRIAVDGASASEMAITARCDSDSSKTWRGFSNTGNTSSYMINNNNAGVYMPFGNTSWSSHSDERVKENIVALGTVLPELLNMRCVKYNRIGDSGSDRTKIGFIAQDWESTPFSEVVDEDTSLVIESDGTVSTDFTSESTTAIKSIAYTETIPVLLKAIQELEARITTLEG